MGFEGRGNFSQGPRQMFDATCSNCGKATQVPFQPKQGRPVFCRDCYMARRDQMQ